MIKFQQWPNFSKNPFGTLVSIIGDIGVMDTESKVILLGKFPIKFPLTVFRAQYRVPAFQPTSA
ncbi:MAG: hypothetical protein ACK56I_06865 [bacterium]|jgi:exoribonuclease R